MESKMRITFTNNGDVGCKELCIKLHPTGCPTRMCVTWECDTEIERFALEKLLREDLEMTIETLVKKAYLEGWHDHRQKKRKATQFTSQMKYAHSPSSITWR